MKFIALFFILFFAVSVCGDLSQNLARLELELSMISKLLPEQKEPASLTEQEKSASDQALALKIMEIAQLESVGLVGMEGYFKMLDKLAEVKDLAQEKRIYLEKFINNLKNLFNKELKLPNKEEDKGKMLNDFWEIKNNLLKPSKLLIEYHEKLINWLNNAFYNEAFLAEVQLFPSYTNVKQSLQTLLISGLVAQRLTSRDIDKDASDKAAADTLGFVLQLLEGQADRNLKLYAQVVDQFDFLRLRPNFQKFQGLLKIEDMKLPILRILLNPKDAGFSLSAGDAFVGRQHVEPALKKLFFNELDEIVATRFEGKKPIKELLAALLKWFKSKFNV